MCNQADWATPRWIAPPCGGLRLLRPRRTMSGSPPRHDWGSRQAGAAPSGIRQVMFAPLGARAGFGQPGPGLHGAPTVSAVRSPGRPEASGSCSGMAAPAGAATYRRGGSPTGSHLDENLGDAPLAERAHPVLPFGEIVLPRWADDRVVYQPQSSIRSCERRGAAGQEELARPGGIRVRAGAVGCSSRSAALDASRMRPTGLPGVADRQRAQRRSMGMTPTYSRRFLTEIEELSEGAVPPPDPFITTCLSRERYDAKHLQTGCLA